MIEVEETGGGLRVVDAAKNEVELEIEDWEPGGEPLEIDRDVDKCIAGFAKRVRLAKGGVLVQRGPPSLGEKRPQRLQELPANSPNDDHRSSSM